MNWETLKPRLEARLFEPVLNHQNLSQSSFCETYRIETATESFFLKWGPHLPEDTFRLEAEGLLALAHTDTVATPKVIHFENDFLLLEFIEEVPFEDRHWIHLGQKLALLHRHSFRQYGWKDDNYLGRTRQINRPLQDQWIPFFTENRLQYQINIALEKGFTALEKPWAQLKPRIPEILHPGEEQPSLIHGDLWKGNVLANAHGEAVLIDPALSFGHRELELSMAFLFGGFPPLFFETYQRDFPLRPGWENRVEFYGLYHLLNHLNLFGRGYLEECLARMNRTLTEMQPRPRDPALEN